MNLDFSQMSPVDRYRVMIQSVVPRPIAWTLTRNESGSFNVAPFSYFNALHSHPPLLVMSIGNKRDKSVKDTRRNIERDKRYVVHIPSREHAEAVTCSSAPLPAEESEMDHCGLETIAFGEFPLPRLKTARIAFACQLERVLEIGENKQGVIIGEICHMHIDDSIVTRSEDRLLIDAMKLNPLGRLGGNDYASLGEVITVPRPEYRPN